MRTPILVHCHGTSQHDAGVALLLGDGDVVALASERVTGIKHDGKADPAYTYLKRRYPFSAATVDCYRDVGRDGYESDDHHRYHAASAFGSSGFDRAAVLVVDGQGGQGNRLVSFSLWSADGAGLTLVETDDGSTGKFHPRSIGHFYTAVGALAGMANLFEEGKTMALAAYGRPSDFLTWMRRYAGVQADGRPHVDERFILSILGHTFGPRFYDWAPPDRERQEIWNEYLRLRGEPMRAPGASPAEADQLVAFAGQAILEEMMLGLARRAASLTGQRNLCLAGGVALNCPANSRIASERWFDTVYVPPAPADDGQAVGKLFLDARARGLDVRATSRVYLGPEYAARELDAAVADDGRWNIAATRDRALSEAAARLADGQIGAVFTGRSELGPRALGHRSIVVDPRNVESRDTLNRRIKHREPWRPVAPAVLEESVERYFGKPIDSPFMSFVGSGTEAAVREIPAALHVDGTARLQTVSAQTTPLLYGLIREFERSTGAGALINTSFNDQAPIIEQPPAALQAAAEMELDFLLFGERLLVPTTRDRRGG